MSNSKNQMISVIIVTYNGGKYINRLLTSLLNAIKFYDETEVVIVDNNSSDETLKLIEEYKPLFEGKIKLVRLSKNLGFAGGNNVGIALSEGELILLLNQDTYVDASALREIASFFREKPRVGVAQCLLLQYFYPSLADSCGDSFSSIGLGIMNCFGERPERVLTRLRESREISMARGAALIIRRSILNISKLVCGTYIPKYFVTGGYEDWYLSLLAKSLGYSVELIPECKVYHDSLRQRPHDPYILYNALSLFIVLKAPLRMLLGRAIISMFAVVIMKASPLKLLYTIPALFRSLKQRLGERYIFDKLMGKKGVKPQNLWEPRISSTQWLRWYINYLRLTQNRNVTVNKTFLLSNKSLYARST
ncbi:MAG: glycosyltransferase family 2 protein [Candidatus Korarchaeota archaeon]